MLNGEESIERPLVCICIPCFNNENTIFHTLESLVNQTYPNMVIKVFDNASTDATVAVVQEFIERGVSIQLVRRAVNIGGEGNFNECIKNVEGTYAAIFHADDIYHPEIVAAEVDFLQRTSSCGAVSAHACFIDAEGAGLGDKFLPPEVAAVSEKAFSKIELLNLVYKYGNFITCPSVLFRTEVLRGGIRRFRSELFDSSSDLDVWIRVAEMGGMGIINKTLISYRLSEASFSYSRAAKRTEDADMFLVLDHYLHDPQLTAADRHLFSRQRDFLLARDRASTNVNRLILGVTQFQAMPIWHNFRFSLTSFFHFKAFVLSLAVKILIAVPLVGFLGSTLRYLRYDR